MIISCNAHQARVGLKRRHFLLIGSLFIFIGYWNYSSCPTDSEECLFTPVEQATYRKCLDGYLYGTTKGAGLGNVIFEVLGFIAVANRTNRHPIVSNPLTIFNMEKFTGYLPSLALFLDESKDTRDCNCFRHVVSFERACCRVDRESMQRIDGSNDTYRIDTFYTQGIGYISMLPVDLVKNLLKASDGVVDLAQYQLFPFDPRRPSKKNFCIHTRRGDFLTSTLVYGSEETFTIQATNFILNREKQPMDIYAFGNDKAFLSRIFSSWPNASLAPENKNFPPNVEFEFSRLYCDVVLLTASASTYGWWIGYLSRGQRVYYNHNFSRPNGLEREMERKDFFPSHWTPLDLITSIQIVL